MVRKILSILLLAALLVSCHPETDVTTEYETPSTWGELFRIFWDKMSSNYIFWSLDYDHGSGWEDVYKEYNPLFNALGGITKDGEQSKTAFQYFYEITSELSDGHYYVDITDGEDLFTAYPNMRRKMLSFEGYDYSEEDVFNLLDSWDGEQFTLFFKEDEDGELTVDTDSIYYPYYQTYYENISYILVNSLGTSASTPEEDQRPGIPGGDYGDTETDETDSQLFDVTYLYGTVDDNYFLAVSGLSSDNIAYFGLYSFLFTAVENTRSAQQFLELYRERVSNADGVIIDLRGNSGGYMNDLQILWPSFTNGHDVHFADSRRKDGDNRLDYGVWLDVTVEDEGCSFNPSVPVAVLMNGRTASSGESSVLFFKALRDDYGFNIRFIGETTFGAFGALLEKNSEEYYNAGTTSIEPYITTIYTPFCQVRYKDGTSYEGKGIEPDDEVAFDYDAFMSGTDDKLEKALEWVRSQI